MSVHRWSGLVSPIRSDPIGVLSTTGPKGAFFEKPVSFWTQYWVKSALTQAANPENRKIWRFWKKKPRKTGRFPKHALNEIKMVYSLPQYLCCVSLEVKGWCPVPRVSFRFALNASRHFEFTDSYTARENTIPRDLSTSLVSWDCIQVSLKHECDKFCHLRHVFFNVASYYQYLNCLVISRFPDSPWDLEAKPWEVWEVSWYPKLWVSRSNHESWQVCKGNEIDGFFVLKKRPGQTTKGRCSLKRAHPRCKNLLPSRVTKKTKKSKQ